MVKNFSHADVGAKARLGGDRSHSDRPGLKARSGRRRWRSCRCAMLAKGPACTGAGVRLPAILREEVWRSALSSRKHRQRARCADDPRRSPGCPANASSPMIYARNRSRVSCNGGQRQDRHNLAGHGDVSRSDLRVRPSPIRPLAPRYRAQHAVVGVVGWRQVISVGVDVGHKRLTSSGVKSSGVALIKYPASPRRRSQTREFARHPWARAEARRWRRPCRLPWNMRIDGRGQPGCWRR